MGFFRVTTPAAPPPQSAANQAASTTVSSANPNAGHFQAIPGVQMNVPAGHMEVGSNGPFDTQTTNSLIKKLAPRSIY